MPENVLFYENPSPDRDDIVVLDIQILETVFDASVDGFPTHNDHSGESILPTTPSVASWPNFSQPDFVSLRSLILIYFNDK